jgi:hypothetical protein
MTGAATNAAPQKRNCRIVFEMFSDDIKNPLITTDDRG